MGRAARDGASRVRLRAPAIRRPDRGEPLSVTPFDRLGRFVVRRALVGRRRLGVAPPRRHPVRARGSRASCAPAASSSTTSSRPGRRPLLETELGVAAVGARRRLHQPDRWRPARPRSRLAAADAARDIAGGAARRPRRVAHPRRPRQVSADRHTAYDVVFLDLPPDDSPDALPILRERLHAGARPRRCELAGGPGVLRRRPDRVGGRPAAERADLAAAGRAGAARSCSARSSRRACRSSSAARRSRRARRHLRRRLGHADEHLRAQPRDAPRPRPRRRLLAAA